MPSICANPFREFRFSVGWWLAGLLAKMLKRSDSFKLYILMVAFFSSASSSTSLMRQTLNWRLTMLFNFFPCSCSCSLSLGVFLPSGSKKHTASRYFLLVFSIVLIYNHSRWRFVNRVYFGWWLSLLYFLLLWYTVLLDGFVCKGVRARMCMELLHAFIWPIYQFALVFAEKKNAENIACSFCVRAQRYNANIIRRMIWKNANTMACCENWHRKNRMKNRHTTDVKYKMQTNKCDWTTKNNNNNNK